MHGLHLVGDLYDCACEPGLLAASDALLACTKSLCALAGLTVVGESVYEFPGGGYTLAVLLAESHVTLHTWPEHRTVAMDVYVCNHTQDNSDKARAVAQGIVEALHAQGPQFKEIERGEI